MPRQLPIVGQQKAPRPGSVPAPEDPEDRPPWHWSGIGAVLVFTSWLPLALVADWVKNRLLVWLVPVNGHDEVGDYLAHVSAAKRFVIRAAVVGPGTLSFVIAATFGGWLVGRFGARAGPKEAAVAGLLAASTGWAVLAAGDGLGGAWMLWPPVALVGTLASWVGGRVGRRSRPPSARL